MLSVVWVNLDKEPAFFQEDEGIEHREGPSLHTANLDPIPGIPQGPFPFKCVVWVWLFGGLFVFFFSFLFFEGWGCRDSNQ